MSKKNKESENAKASKEESDECKLEKYKIIIEARNFHYENFNKWMTYFYVAIGALFVAYTTVSKADNNEALKWIILIFAYVTSLLFYWSAKGYYFWNIHWIRMIQDYEERVLGWDTQQSIYRIFYNKDLSNKYWSPVTGANFSTSKITLLFSFLIAVVWGTLIISSLIIPYYYCEAWLAYLLGFFLSVLVTVTITSLMKMGPLNSYIKEMPDLTEVLKKKT